MITEYHTLLTSNAIFIKRTASIGILPPAMAIDYACTGPVLRGSGVDRRRGGRGGGERGRWRYRRQRGFCALRGRIWSGEVQNHCRRDPDDR